MEAREILVVLYVLAAALPLVGFGRLMLRAQRGLREASDLVAERGHAAPTLADFDRGYADIRDEPRQNRSDIAWDIVFVGLGLAAGSAASIWSLFLVPS